MNCNKKIEGTEEHLVQIRQADKNDAFFIAKNILAAMGWDVFDPEYDMKNDFPIDPENDFTEGAMDEREKRTERMLKIVTDVCADEKTLYSYKNTYIAMVDGKPAGSLTGYSGDNYLEMKQATYNFVKNHHGVYLTPSETETVPGEFYLDSMAVDPAFRGYSIGRKLIRKMTADVNEAGFDKVTLIAEKARPWLVHMYEGLGFNPESEMPAFGTTYIRMVNKAV